MLRTVGEGKSTPVGVIVGRFQTPDLHEGHLQVIESVVARHPHVVIVLGLAPIKATSENPLDFEPRKQMIQDAYPDIEVIYLEDHPNDLHWVKSLDKLLERFLPPGANATLYGSRDSFLNTYISKGGSHPTVELIPDKIISASEVRKLTGLKKKASSDYRHGVVWATQNQYPTAYHTVDVLIVLRDGDGEVSKVLFGEKAEDKGKLRFIGGFVNPAEGRQGSVVEDNAKREVREETGLEVSEPKYLGSFLIDDWRYRKEKDKIITSLFMADYVFGPAKAGDDIDVLHWVSAEELKDLSFDTRFSPSHLPLLNCVRGRLGLIYETK